MGIPKVVGLKTNNSTFKSCLTFEYERGRDWWQEKVEKRKK